MHRSQKMQYSEAETFCENLPCRETRSGSIFVTAEGNASQGGRDAVIAVGQTRAKEIASGLSQRAARLPWAHQTRLQQLHPLLLTTNVSNKSGNLLSLKS
jgi:hypothetical protein